MVAQWLRPLHPRGGGESDQITFSAALDDTEPELKARVGEWLGFGTKGAITLRPQHIRELTVSEPPMV